MRSTKTIRHKPEQEGIYLEDLNLQEMEPEMAALYFPKRFAIYQVTTWYYGQSLSFADQDWNDCDTYMRVVIHLMYKSIV